MLGAANTGILEEGTRREVRLTVLFALVLRYIFGLFV